MKNSLLCFLVLFPLVVFGNPDSVFLKISVLTGKKPLSLVITPEKGSYEVLENGKTVTTLPQHVAGMFRVDEGKIRFSKPAGSLGRFDSLVIRCGAHDGILHVRFGKENYRYDDDLHLSVKEGFLRVINRVNLEKYTASVVLSEGGDKGTIEFYKLQGLISRTYALKNMRKHEKEGFHLCDQVHCQLYRGHTRRTDILNAMFDTRGLVILGPDSQLISAAFHSNSGGETVNSEDVWSQPAPYLRAVTDSFSLAMPMAYWEKKIEKTAWMDLLVQKYHFPADDSLMLDSALHFRQPHRLRNYTGGIPLRELRAAFNLRSTFFETEPSGDHILLKGRGYGHGVGLSQEGALNMTRKGYCFEEILKFYYQDILIVPLTTDIIFRSR